LAEIAMQNSATEQLMNLTLYQLLHTFNKVVTRFEIESKKFQHKVVQYPYTISGEKSTLAERIRTSGQVAFTDLITSCENKVHAIFTFLAVLELLQEQAIRITLGIGFNNFWLAKPEEVNA
ncbi:MAG: segregation/condensation protein A, partial [Bacteroidota bacterium]